MSTPKNDSIVLATTMNAIAGQLMKLDRPILEREKDPYKGKISLGLSFQAAELALKSILKSLGWSNGKIRKHFGNHNLYRLAKGVASELEKSDNMEILKHSRFLLSTLEIDGIKFRTTIGQYLKIHFDEKDSSHRNYFYSDSPTFLLPSPPNLVHVIGEQLIQMAIAVENA